MNENLPGLMAGLIIVGVLFSFIGIMFLLNLLTKYNIAFKCKSNGPFLHPNASLSEKNETGSCKDCGAKWKLMGYMPSQTETPFPIWKRIETKTT